MSEGRILFQGPIKEIWKDEEDSTGLSRVLTERAQYFRDLRFDGKTWEEARKLTDEKFDPIIDKILYPNGHKEKKKITLKDQGDGTYASDWSPYLKIIGKGNHNLTVGGGRSICTQEYLFRRSFISVLCLTGIGYTQI